MGNKHSNRKKLYESDEKDIESTSDRMNLGQNVMREIWQGNFSSPIDDVLKKGARVLDHDILKGLPFEDNSFDFVRAQMLTFDIAESDWKNIVYKEFCRVLKPGGWLEMVELELTWYNPGPLTTQLYNSGIDPLLTKRHKELMLSMPNLTLVQQEERIYPLGSWAGKIGILAETFINDSCRNVLSWAFPKKDIEKTLNKMSAESETYRSYLITFRLFAKKT
ncbi:761_t:CDS:2 [Dentiscutata erythropus]|uniref:761_t:CDS:1 n=1 Tax=Dentiscutata erythropus TaxID=1348616 RepID=A0A9N8WT73_9GLOM|nr:761_t:CDS:2 [Dentiscutata erythropus]